MFWLWLAANAIALLLAAVEALNLREFPLLQPGACDETIDAVVAMRDEERHAAAFLDAVLAAPRIARVIVTDDGSSDATFSILQAYAQSDARVVVQRARGAGKSPALAQGAAAASAPWLLFLDADVRITAAAPDALVAFASERNAAAATMWPRVRDTSFAGMLFAPLVTLLLLQLLPMRLARTSDPRAAAGNGQGFLVRADAYAASGGHAAVTSPVEDVALARALKRAGYTVALASGASIATVEGYASFGEAVRGYARSLYFGAGIAGSAATLLWLLILLLAPLPLYAARVLTASRMHESALSVALAPLGVACGIVSTLHALIAGSCGRLEWRGRALRG